MMKNKIKSDFTNIRQRAEELLKKKHMEPGSTISEADTIKLIHELEVHQAELEILNEELVLAKEQAVRSAEKYTELYDFAPSGYFTLSRQGAITDINLSGAKMLGYERSMVKNRLFGFFVTDSSKLTFHNFLDNIFLKKTTETCEVSISTEGQTISHMVLTGIVSENPDQCMVTVFDITKTRLTEAGLERTRKELELAKLTADELSQFAENIIDTVHEPLIVLDKNLMVIKVSRSFYDFFKVFPEETLGKHIGDLGNKQWNIPELIGLLEQIITCNISFENFEVDHHFPVIGKHIMLLNARQLINSPGKEKIILLEIENITDLKKIEIELIDAKIKAEGAQFIAEEARAKAETATHIAEDAVKSKQQFLSNMSHEIRTPMNAIIGFTNILLKTALNEAQRQYLNAVKVSGESLIVLINDILDIAKVDAGKMTFEKIQFNLFESISSMIQLFELKIKEKDIVFYEEFDSAIPQVLVGDPMRLRQIILNLMSNAIKFTSRGEITLYIHLLYADDEKATLEFILKDTGIGIREDRLVHIFDKFEQADKKISNSYGGTGLGLAIVKQLVELQGGSVFVTSELGIGSTFGFSMSFGISDSNTVTQAGEEPENSKEDNSVEPDLKNTRVLIAEDVNLNQLLIKQILLDFGCEIEIAGNGKIAIDLMEKNQYDIILMDLQMPVMNGFEATSYIRNEMNLPIPIIALTADVAGMDLEKCKMIGMDDYISKPIDENLLYNKILKNKKKSQTKC